MVVMRPRVEQEEVFSNGKASVPGGNHGLKGLLAPRTPDWVSAELGKIFAAAVTSPRDV